jgi:2-iminobutanoate/2-iminopropanoate deaminase
LAKQFVDADLNPRWQEDLVRHTGAEEMPFSPAVVAGGQTIYLSGATAYPLVTDGSQGTGTSLPGDIGEQTRLCLRNLGVVLRAAGGKVTDVVKVTIFNTEMEAQEVVNEAYLEFFGDHRPARSHIGVARLVSPELKIEIEAVAVLDD